METKQKFYIVFLLFSFSLIISYIAIDTFFFGNQIKQISLENAIEKTYEREEYFQSFFKNAKNQLLAIRNSEQFNGYLVGENNNIHDLFLTLLRSDHNIKQLRFIDKFGKEKIRVEKMNLYDIGISITENLLEDKSNKEYFKLSKHKPLEEVYFSNFDLHTKNNKIETPYRPTLRAVLPIQVNKKFYGILVINYFMDDFLKKLFHVPLYDLILCSFDGTIIKHYEEKKSWSNALKNSFSIKTEFKNEAKSILQDSLFMNNELVSRRLNLPIDEGMVLIIKLKELYQKELLQNQIYKYALNSFLVFLFAMIISGFLSSFMKKLYTKYYKTEELNKALADKTVQLQKMQHELKLINTTLEERVALEIEKNNKHQILLTQHSKLAQMGEMLGMIAHQWRQPLSAINSAIIATDLFIASKQLKYEDEIKDILDFSAEKRKNISVYVKFLSSTIDDFRNFFKIDKEITVLPISSIIKNALYLVERTLESKGIQLTVNYQDDGDIEVYQNELIQVILNILKNSEDNFYEKQVLNPSIFIKVIKKKNNYTIQIKDNGGGIDKDIMPKLFDLYFSTKLKTNGTGLGLYMSKTIVEEHHKGSLSAYNDKEGAVFMISIPSTK